MRILKNIGLCLLVLLAVPGFAQFDPAGGELGSMAVHSNSSTILSWASKAEVKRGWLDITDTTQGKVVLGNPADVYSKADRFVMSLGDGGEATIILDDPLINHAGFDFAVFENGFSFQDGYFLELAFVELSSDGEKFYRFPSVSLIDTVNQKDNGSILDPTKLKNFAGKHQANYGTPFDLDDLKDSLGSKIDSIKYIRIVDVVGNLNDSFARYDSKGNKVNDPWPTAFNSGGFDLDAVAILGGFASVHEVEGHRSIYPNPASSTDVLYADFNFSDFQIFDQKGDIIAGGKQEQRGILLSGLNPGIYTIHFTTNNSTCTKRLTIY
jgi:hypothetical protein